MRVGLVIYGSLETLSGGYLYDRTLVNYLRECGDQVEVLSIPWRGYPRALATNLSPAVKRQMDALQVDILLQDELCHPSLLTANRGRNGSRAYPVISIVHHLLSSEPGENPVRAVLQRAVERAYLRRVDGFIFNSQTTCEVVLPLAGTAPPWTVARPGGDRFDPCILEIEIVSRAAEPGPLRLIFLGNLIPRKGCHILVKSLGRIRDLGWELDVVGSLAMDRSYVERVRALAKKVGVAERIHFMGPLVDRQLSEQMQNHHLMVLPSFYEGYGIAYLEAMGFGMPVIGTSAGAAGEIITDGVDGFLVPPGDSISLANLLGDLIEDRTRLAGMGIAARHHFAQHPTWEETVEKIRIFLLHVLEDGRKQSPV